MNTSIDLTKLYDLFLKTHGPIQARQFVTAIVANTLSDIQEAGLKVTPELFEEIIHKEVNDFLEAARASKVA